MQTKKSGFRECRQRIGDLGQRITLNYLLCLLKCTFQWVLYMGKYYAVGTKASGGFNGNGVYLSFMVITRRRAKKQAVHSPPQQSPRKAHRKTRRVRQHSEIYSEPSAGCRQSILNLFHEGPKTLIDKDFQEDQRGFSRSQRVH